MPLMQLMKPRNALASISLKISTAKRMIARVATFFQPEKMPFFETSVSDFVRCLRNFAFTFSKNASTLSKTVPKRKRSAPRMRPRNPLQNLICLTFAVSSAALPVGRRPSFLSTFAFLRTPFACFLMNSFGFSAVTPPRTQICRASSQALPAFAQSSLRWTAGARRRTGGGDSPAPAARCPATGWVIRLLLIFGRFRRRRTSSGSSAWSCRSIRAGNSRDRYSSGSRK